MPPDEAGSGPGRVLIVDDEAGIRALFSRQLRLAGFDVVCAESGAEGLRVLRADTSIRLILLDLMMPEMNGWHFRDAQLLDPRLADIPAVIVSGASLTSMVHEQLQAADYLLKPVGREHLISVVQNFCEPAALGS